MKLTNRLRKPRLLALGAPMALMQCAPNNGCAAAPPATYGPLLRYVDVGGTNVGLDLIQGGLAVARYDSRGGYGAHPRLGQYIAADPAHPTTASPPASRRSGRASSECGEVVEPHVDFRVIRPEVGGHRVPL
jgi:hypothetical protein